MIDTKNNVREVRYPQSAVIPFQIKNDQPKVLLITSIKSGQWIFPKGIIENHLSPQSSALQEAREEAGAEGEVINLLLGEYSYPKWGGICEVVVYPMYVTKVLDDWPEATIRKRKWVTIEEAMTLISKKELQNLLKVFKRKMETIKSKVKVS